ncbi:NUDIX domain-containing protein [Maribacter sp. ACAM166]|uniref:NUDIX domain-containing protein n=1 Tax=Maribacter sp. ACAM166 TaxID=2508996 RepID=UPI0010FE06FB|nr:NUDIX domain-containing protein [Maribacter sp. ACAM166]TLP81787.1 NUDIX domain-containing protein [Maribacter sp. ACAM166]
MPKQSAGILLYRWNNKALEVLLVHPGGPFWAKKDIGVWSIPKGEIEPDENPLYAAIRETEEETGLEVQGEFTPLKSQKQKSGKVIHAWSVKGDFDISKIESNSFEMEWPPKSSKKALFPEIDKASWFDLIDAKLKIVRGQMPFILELEKLINQ